MPRCVATTTKFLLSRLRGIKNCVVVVVDVVVDVVVAVAVGFVVDVLVAGFVAKFVPLEFRFEVRVSENVLCFDRSR